MFGHSFGSSARILSLGLAWSAAISGCAGSGSLRRIEDASLAEVQPSAEAARFEVREQAEQSQAAAPATPVAGPKKKGARLGKPVPSVAQTFVYPNRRPTVDPFRVGEKVVYSFSYLGVSAGEATVRILPFKQINGRKVYHATAEARSSKVFSLFYKLHDSIESFIDYETIAPHRYHIVLDETKQKRNSLELYDSEKGRSFYWTRWHHHQKGYVEIKDYFPMQPFSQDSFSSLYFLRSRPLKDGDVEVFPVISEGKNWDAVVTVMGRETINTPLGKIRAIKLKPETKYAGILKKQGDSFVWLSDDDRRWLLRIEAKVKIGTIVIAMESLDPGSVTQAAGAAPLVDEVLPPGASKP